MPIESSIAVFEAVDRHFLNALRMYWYRSIAFGLGEGALLTAFVWRYGRASGDDDPLAVVLAAFGLAVAVLGAVVAVSTVQRIETWRDAFVTSSQALDDDSIIERAESSHRIANATQASALLPAIAASCWAAALVIYAVRSPS
jgi:hypothetical protein